MVSEGKKAPDFSLKDKDGNMVSLKGITTDYVVVYFYPKDNTPGCTLEAIDFTARKKKFLDAGATVVGISGGDEKSKTKFCEKNKLSIILLSDPDFAVAEAYGAYGQKKFMGRTFLGVKRSTYVLDKQRKVIKVFENVSAKDHAAEVLEFIKGL